MNSKGTGLTLSIGVVIGLIGYILWQLTIGFDTKSDDVVTILQNSASGATSVQIASILICVGLVTHVAGLISTRGTAPGTCETLGITLIVSAIVVWVASSGLGIALAEMGEKFVAASAGAAAGDAASIAAVAICLGVLGKSGCFFAVSPEPVTAHDIKTLLIFFLNKVYYHIKYGKIRNIK